MRVERKERDDNVVIIEKDVKLPESDIILEKGDKIMILDSRKEKKDSFKKREKKEGISDEARERIQERMRNRRNK